jgi:hypothetical protein
MKEYSETDSAYLVDHRTEFNELVYTPFGTAVEELKRRWNDEDLTKKVDDFLGGDVPEPLKQGFTAIIFRQLATPNYELRRFFAVPDVLELKPVFWEYHDDKFTSNNPLKHALGKMPFLSGYGKKGGAKIEYRNVIDFNESNGKKIKDVRTVWGEPFVEFHHDLLREAYPKANDHIFDASEWFARHDGHAKDYYIKYVSLFIRHGILFENFVLEGEDHEFTRDVFLPAFFKLWKMMGVKPLIVALAPTDIEGDVFWICHPSDTVKRIDGKVPNKTDV